MDFTITLTAQELAEVEQALMARPYYLAAPVIGTLAAQCAGQGTSTEPTTTADAAAVAG